MSLDSDFDRAHFFFMHDRYAEAQAVLAKTLASYPDDSDAHALMAYCEHYLGRGKQAKQMAEHAVGLNPQSPYALMVLGHIHFEQGRHKPAEKAFREALALSPEEANLYGLLALSLAGQSRWRESLEAAETGLECDPENVNCHNARVQALTILGRKAEAHDAVRETMSDNSENPVSQAVAGWSMLRAGRVNDAIAHFREALRLDPNFEDAREGMVEALRAKFPVYRAVIGWQVWLARLPSGVRLFVTLGLYILARTTVRVSNNPFLVTVAGIYVAFVLFSWFGGPILNITLLMHPLGRIALSRNEKREAISLAWGLASIAIAIGVAVLAKSNVAAAGAIVAGLLLFIGLLVSLLESVKSKTVLVLLSTYAGVFVALGSAIYGLVSGR